MIKVLVIDDEELARRRIVELLSDFSEIQMVGECESGQEAIDQVLEKQPDLIYLDIKLPDMTGFDVLEAIPKDLMPMVIFVSAFDEYAIKAFDVFSFDYLLKPLRPERFSISLEKALESLRY